MYWCNVPWAQRTRNWFEIISINPFVTIVSYNGYCFGSCNNCCLWCLMLGRQQNREMVSLNNIYQRESLPNSYDVHLAVWLALPTWIKRNICLQLTVRIMFNHKTEYFTFSLPARDSVVILLATICWVPTVYQNTVYCILLLARRMQP